MHKTVRLLLVVSIVLATTTFTPVVTAVPTREIGTEYYDECMNLIYSHIITCNGAIFEWGSTAGAKYKNEYRLDCEGSGYTSYWYEWNGSSWVRLPSVPITDC